MSRRHQEIDEISRAVVRIQAGVLAIVGAALGGLAMFVMTAWLVIKDGPNVGAHLRLLSNYFVGYSVTWTGSLVGLFYGALTGGIIAWVIGTIYNYVVGLRDRGKTLSSRVPHGQPDHN